MRQDKRAKHDRSQRVHCALVLAGGSGTRLWPMSRTDRPKQLLAITEARSLFRASIERLLPIVAEERIFVVAGEHQLPALRKEASFLPAENFIGEPSGKDTAPATLLGMAFISARYPEATLSIFPADHHIRDEEGFRTALVAAVELAQSTDAGQIITLGIQPTFPAIGFGYLQLGPSLGEKSGYAYHPVLKFVEKPVVELARKYYESGEYRWNAGMFVWTLSRAWSEFQRLQPEAMSTFLRLSQQLARGEAIDLPTAWEIVEALPLDIAVMEHAADMWVIPVELGWSDVGSWSSVFDVLPRDEAGNYGKTLDENGNVQFTASRDTLILSETAKHIVALGVKDLVIIETDEALLVCHRERAQEVRSIVKQLSLNG